MRYKVSVLLDKAKQAEGLYPEEARWILEKADTEEWKRIFETARDLTQEIFKKQLCFFVPLYFSNFCMNDCLYCGFRRSNTEIERKALTVSRFIEEARFLWRKGHRTLLLIAGEHPAYSGVEQIIGYLAELHKENLPFSISVEIGPLDLESYRALRALGVRHCLLFQETYDRQVYGSVHRGPKKNFDWRLKSMERAKEAGIPDIGLGILLGLHDYHEDLPALIEHAWTFKQRFGNFPATFSFPRIRAAQGVDLRHFREVPDEDYQKIIALTRLAVPSAGMVLSTRETAAMRDSLLDSGIGITHVSAGSCTVPGGYTEAVVSSEKGQFQIKDNRPLFEVLNSVTLKGYTPQCRREDFVLSKPVFLGKASVMGVTA